MTLRILTVVGARPQFVKAAVFSRAARAADAVTELVVHTGQHFDDNMSAVFFDELEMPAPDYNLGIGGGTHGENTGRMLEAVEAVVAEQNPDWVLVYGDTDSTLAGALAAIKRHVRVAHVEAGLRSYNRRMPEEINRVLTDHASTVLFAPTSAAVANLAREGLSGPRVCLAGDVMYDAAIYFGRKARSESRILAELDLAPRGYVLLTLHRPSNTDDPARLRAILSSLALSPRPVVWPLHPRSRIRLAEHELSVPATVRVIDPVGYLDMALLESSAALVATDSGGVQKEAFFHKVPCVTLRNETEWTELVALGANRLSGDDLRVFEEALVTPPAFPAGAADALYGDGNAGEKILSLLQRWESHEC